MILMNSESFRMILEMNCMKAEGVKGPLIQSSALYLMRRMNLFVLVGHCQVVLAAMNNLLELLKQLRDGDGNLELVSA